MINDHDRAEIDALLTRYQQTWSSLELEQLSELWDLSEPSPLYVAEENPGVMCSYAEIRAYWKHTRGFIERLRVRLSGVRLTPVGPGLMAVVAQMQHQSAIAPTPGRTLAPVGGFVRIFALLRSTPAGWRFCHYVESPLGALPFIRAYYQQNVDEDFKRGAPGWPHPNGASATKPHSDLGGD